LERDGKERRSLELFENSKKFEQREKFLSKKAFSMPL
jgi:hypothetical protein